MPSKKRSAGSAAPAAMQTPCSKCPLRRNDQFRPFQPDELEFIQDFKVGELRVQAGSSILLDGHDSPHLFSVLEGWAVRFKILDEGQRQVLNFAVPGDLIGLQSTLFDKMHHSVEALTDLRLCVFARERIWELYKQHPGLGFDLTWLAAREESIMSDHLVNVGQRSAFERLAYIIVYIFNHARRSGLVKGNKLITPVTQEHLADAMGLSMVHTNKTLKKLRQTGWLDWKRQELSILDEEKLTELAAFDLEKQRARPFL
jgi:CRP/FNR family transcriptional regulator